MTYCVKDHGMKLCTRQFTRGEIQMANKNMTKDLTL